MVHESAGVKMQIWKDDSIVRNCLLHWGYTTLSTRQSHLRFLEITPDLPSFTLGPKLMPG